MSEPSRTPTGVRVLPGDKVVARARGAGCHGQVTQAPTDANHAYMWCVHCRAAHVLQNPLHHFWTRADSTTPENDLRAFQVLDLDVAINGSGAVTHDGYRTGDASWLVDRWHDLLAYVRVLAISDRSPVEEPTDG